MCNFIIILLITFSLLSGYYCNTTGAYDTIICPRGQYCPLGSDYPTPCPRGTQLNTEGRYEEGHCDPCDAGYACDSVGTVTATTLCSPGYYCLAGSNSSMPTGALCPEGYYCPSGTLDYTRTPCQNGTYGNYSGMTDSSDCLPCDPGKACVGLALTEPNAVCAEGYFCRGGAYSDQPKDAGLTGNMCQPGFYCPAGTGEPIQCPPGSFSNTTQLSSCYDCPAGYYCTDGENAHDCPYGHYCPGNTTLNQPLCPIGTYNNQIRQFSFSSLKRILLWLVLEGVFMGLNVLEDVFFLQECSRVYVQISTFLRVSEWESTFLRVYV